MTRPPNDSSAEATPGARPFVAPPGRHAERLTEARNPATRTLDRVSLAEGLAMLHEQDRIALDAAAAAAPQVERAIELVVASFRAGGRLVYVGAGTSGRLGVLDASEQPPTYGVPPEMVQGIIAGGPGALVRSVEGAEDDARAGAAAIDAIGSPDATDTLHAPVGPRDTVMGITTGGRAPYVLAALARARELGASTVLLTCTPPLEGEENLADVRIDALVGPEPVTGSTRMKAGTATKLILNRITTLAMVAYGKVFENLMVDMRPTNEKLRDRAARILIEVSGGRPDAAPIGRERALELLGEAGGDLKTAIAACLGGGDVTAARRLLAEEGGHVARAIRRLRGAGN